MKEDTPYLNEAFAMNFVDQLVQQGITTFCTSPGSRNTPLLRAIAKHKKIDSVVHFDERGSSFFALGASKATKKAVCIVVTSGTAAGHLLPAIMEASNSYIPLIIITCDRPSELHHCGFNQTISQTSMFEKYVKWEININPPDASIPLSYLKSVAAESVLKASSFPFGPVHINFQFREPFFANNTTHIDTCDKTVTLTPEKHLHSKDLTRLSNEIQQHSKGLIITGCDAFPHEDAKELIAISEALNFPIFSDVLSGLRGFEHDNIIKHHTLLCSLEDIQDSLVPTCIIYFGKQYVSKSLLYWIKSKKIEKFYHIHDSLDTQDPFYKVTDKIAITPSIFCKDLLPFLNSVTCESYLKDWKRYSSEAEVVLSKALLEYKNLNEAYFFHELSKATNFENTNLFISNSMPIRNADAYFYPKFKSTCYGTRGVSGIDGNIAITLGIAHATKKRTLAILGDVATLHDLNSLAMVSNIKSPVIFFVINNQGGSIFSFLPISSDTSCLDKFFATKHEYNFKSICQMFKINYRQATSIQDIEALIVQTSKINDHMLIEVKTHYNENINIQKMMVSKLREYFNQYALC